VQWSVVSRGGNVGHVAVASAVCPTGRVVLLDRGGGVVCRFGVGDGRDAERQAQCHVRNPNQDFHWISPSSVGRDVRRVGEMELFTGEDNTVFGHWIYA
jgi:hypothetical protein